MLSPDPEILSLLENTLVRLCLGKEAALQHDQGNISKSLLDPALQGVQKLSSAYIQESLTLPVFHFSENELSAYALYYLPINLIKLVHAFQKIPKIILKPKIRVLDFGAGPGTALYALLSLTAAEVEYTAIERSPEMSRFLKSILHEVSEKLRRPISCIAAESLKDVQGTFDLAIAANSLCELPEKDYGITAEDLFAKISAHGALVLLDPGTRTHGRRLMLLRNELLEQHKDLHVIFPCTHTAQCPMLRDSELDWCHGTLDAQGAGLSAFRVVRQIDSLIGFNKHRVKYSCLILGEQASPPTGDRVIIAPHKTNRGAELLVCGSGSLKKFILPKSQRSENNRALLHVKQYGKVLLENVSESGKLDKNSKISLFIE